MEPNKILSGNLSIMKFMGDRIEIEAYGAALPDKKAFYYYHNGKRNYLTLEENGSIIFLWNNQAKKAKYHLSWDWLMPVVEKIFGQRFETDPEYVCFRTFGMRNIDTGDYMVRIERMILCEAPTLIEATWLAVVDYIESFNK